MKRKEKDAFTGKSTILSYYVLVCSIYVGFDPSFLKDFLFYITLKKDKKESHNRKYEKLLWGKKVEDNAETITVSKFKSVVYRNVGFLWKNLERYVVLTY